MAQFSVGANTQYLKAKSEHENALQNRVPAEWLGHFLRGTGTPKIMSAQQVDQATKNVRLQDLTCSEGAAQALGAQIDAMKAKNQSQGHVEGLTKQIPRHASRTGGWGNALGGAHFSAVFKGNWTTDPSDGSMRFKGERRFVVQDRYNWEAPEFNGSHITPEAPIPGFVVKALPRRYQSAFNPLPGGKLVGEIDDASLAHLQMIKGGAQRFWTVGVGSPTAVDFTVNAQGEWSVTKAAP